MQICRDTQRVYFGEAPTLGLVRAAYGRNIAEVWLELQLNDLSEFAGCKEKITKSQLVELSAMMLDEYGYFKLTEFMMFFQQMKRGHYGKFYGAVDPMQIMAALRDFYSERDKVITERRKVQENECKAAERAIFERKRRRYQDRVPKAFSKEAAATFLQYDLLGMDEMSDDVLHELLGKVAGGVVTLHDRAEAIIKQRADISEIVAPTML